MISTNLLLGKKSGECTPTLSFLRVSRAKTPMTFQYKLKGTTLMEEKTTKYLGVDLQANLAWNHRINRVIKKVNSMFGFSVVIRGMPAKKPRIRLMFPWSGQTWIVPVPSGIFTIRTRNTKWRWSSAGRHVL